MKPGTDSKVPRLQDRLQKLGIQRDCKYFEYKALTFPISGGSSIASTILAGFILRRQAYIFRNAESPNMHALTTKKPTLGTTTRRATLDHPTQGGRVLRCPRGLKRRDVRARIAQEESLSMVLSTEEYYREVCLMCLVKLGYS